MNAAETMKPRKLCISGNNTSASDIAIVPGMIAEARPYLSAKRPENVREIRSMIAWTVK